MTPMTGPDPTGGTAAGGPGAGVGTRLGACDVRRA